VLLLILVLVAGVGAGGAYFVLRDWTPLPTPPEAPPEAEPRVLVSIQNARRAVLDSPRSGEAWGHLAGTFLANELEDEGVACAAVAERLDPLNPRWPYYQGGILLNRGDREGAVRHFRRAAARAASAAEGQDAPALLLAETLLGLGRLEEAAAELERVRERRPNDVRVRFDLGLLAVARQDGTTAREQFRTCLDSPFTREKARRQLAIVAQELGDLAAARQFLLEANLVPKDSEWDDPLVSEYLGKSTKKRTHYRLAEQLEAQGLFLEAAEMVRPLTEDDPNDDLPWLALGKLLAQSPRPWLAEPNLRRAVQLAPGKVQAHHYLGAHLFNEGEAALRRGDKEAARGRFEEAAGCARRALDLKPDYGVAHLTLGLALRRLGQHEASLAALRQAATCNPEHGEVHFRLGEALAQAGRIGEARTRLERAVQLAPPGAGWAQEAKDRLAGLPN
jgi:tetratricopeptide (TPR) repeat protein